MAWLNLRVLAVMGLTLGAVALLATSVEDQFLAPLTVAFGFTILVFLYPFMRRGSFDVFAPPPGFSLQPAIMLLATTAYFADEGSFHLIYVGYMSPDDRASLILEVLFALCVGQISYYIGYYWLRLGPRLARHFPDVASERWNKTRLRLVSLLIAAVAAVGYISFQKRLGLDFLDPAAIGVGRDLLHKSSPETSWITRSINASFLPLFLYLALLMKERRLSKLAVWAVVLLITTALIGRTGGRGSFMVPLLVCLTVYHYLFRRIRLAVIAILAVLALMFSNVFGDYREQVRRREGESVERTLEQTETTPLGTLASFVRQRQTFFVYPLLMNVFPEHQDHLLGQTYLGLGTVLIPRWIWPDKLAFNEWHETTLVPRYGGGPHPTPLLMILYANWSWPGIVIGMLLWGIFHRGLYEWLARAPKDPGVVVLYVMLLYFFAPTLLSFSDTMQYLIPAYLVLKLIRIRTKQQAPVASPSAVKSPRSPSLVEERAAEGLKGLDGAV